MTNKLDSDDIENFTLTLVRLVVAANKIENQEQIKAANKLAYSLSAILAMDDTDSNPGNWDEVE